MDDTSAEIQDLPELMTPQEVARVFRVTPSAVRAWVRNGQIKCLMTPGGAPRFRRDHVVALLASNHAEEAS